MINEVFIVSGRNEVIFSKIYRHDIHDDVHAIFLSKLKEVKKGLIPPHFKENGVTFAYIKRSNICLVAVSKAELTPITVIDLLTRIHHILQDFCSVVSEESVRANQILIDEIMSEILDGGYVQLLSTEKIRPYIQTDPVVVQSRIPKSPSDQITQRLFGIDTRVSSIGATSRAVVPATHHIQTEKKNEIFLDVVERLTVIVKPNGTVSRMEVNGTVNMSCFISGSPTIKIGLNEDMTISSDQQHRGFGSQVNLDRCQFDPCVRLDDFDKSRVLMVMPSDKKVVIMTYNIGGDLPLGLPFRVKVTVDDSSRDTSVMIHVRSEFPANHTAVNVVIKLPVSSYNTSISQQLSHSGVPAEFSPESKHIVWRIREFVGNSEQIATFRLICQSQHKMRREEIGPVSLEFELSGYVPSGFRVRFLKVISSDPSAVYPRWVRYISVSDSYLVKF